MFTVRLDSKNKSYILAVVDNRLPYLVYWGAQLPAQETGAELSSIAVPPVFQGGLDTPYQLNVFPESGRGFRGTPALIGERNGTNWAHYFTYSSHTGDTSTATFQYEDAQAKLNLTLEFILDPSGVMQRRTIVENTDSSPYNINFCAASSTPVPSYCTQVMRFHGCWTGEFMKRTIAFTEGITLTENRTGRTSHEHFPAILAGTDFKENSGTIYACHLGWSGNARCLTELVADGTKQLQCGELLLPGEGLIKPNAHYTSPWNYETCSNSGLNEISRNYHEFFRSKIAPDNLQRKKRPVQFNTWEAVYFDHDQVKLREMAKEAAQLGVERFVLDDGWFHGRSDDTQALGDWWPDREKYPEGLEPLCTYVIDLGMEFGLWVEPEMVNEQSELFANHPDWILQLRGLEPTRGRNQLVLDLSRGEVCDYLFEKIHILLKKHPIAYLKWDMNRILTEAGHGDLPTISNQTKALYNLLVRIRKAHPQVEIESCSSGGGRIDFEILKITERFWASDSNDPFRRLEIQQGASIFFPPEVIGSHMGPKLCHTSGRETELDFRAMVSLAYHFGAEFNILELTYSEKKQVQSYITLYKDKREMFHSGDFTRLEQGENHKTGYGVVSRNKEEAVFFIHQTDLDGQSVDRTVRFAGLAPEKIYKMTFLHPDTAEQTEKIIPTCGDETTSLQQTFSGTVLMEWGIPIFLVWPGRSVVIQFHSIQNR